MDATPECLDELIVRDLMFHYKQHKNGTKLPFVSYDEEVELKYRRKMAKAFKRVLEYYGADV